MMKRLISFMILFTIISLTSCATTNSQQTLSQAVDEIIPLQDLLDQLPAQNAVQQALIMKALIRHGSAGVVSLSGLLTAEDSTARAQAQYALTGLAHYVSYKERPAQRATFVAGVEQALEGTLPAQQKAFLITLLQYCGRDDQVPTLSQFLHDEKLCDPAATALVSIDVPAARTALLSALNGARGDCQVSIVKSLGELRVVPAAGQLMELAKDKNEQVRNAALYALANIGYVPAQDLLLAAARGNASQVANYLLFIKQLANNGQTERSVQLCRNILTGKEGLNREARIAALTILVDATGEKALPEVLQAMQDRDVKVRTAAFRLAERFHATQKWLELYRNAAAPVQAQILELLGRQGAQEAVPVIRDVLQTDKACLRVAAIHAITGVLGDKAVPDLFNALQTCQDEEVLTAIQQRLSTLPSSAIMPVAKQQFQRLPVQGKIMIIELFTARNEKEIVPLLRQSLKSKDERLRLSALKGLNSLAEKDDLNLLLSYWRACSQQSEQRAARNAIVSTFKKCTDKKWAFAQLQQTYDGLDPEKKRQMLSVFKNIGGRRAFQFVQAQYKEAKLRDAAVRALASWPDDSAMDAVVEIAQNEKDQTLRIIAIRGALRMIRENKMGPQRAFFYCRQLMSAAERPQEKRQILAVLATIKTPQALRFAAKFLDDDALNYDAAFAAVKIAGFDEKSAENLKPEQVALAFIEARADKTLAQKIAKNPIFEDDQNKPPKKFVALFNGRDLTGWKGLVANPVKRAQMSAEELAAAQKKADESMRQHWQVIDGVLYFDGKGENLCTARDYGNFELYVDWKIERHGDSGIYLRGTPQVQIWDPEDHPEGSGGLYNNKKHPSKPLVRADRPVGQWNTFHIIMRGERVTVYLNDVLVVDNVVMENYWERDKPIYPRGAIELQSHHSPLYFRNIFIRELPDEEPPFSGPLFNGKDLTGWQVIGNKPDSWKVENGILYTEGKGGGWLSTTREFSDFKLELEFRVPPDGNSGVFLRAPHKGNPAYEGMEIQVLDDYAKKYAKLKPWQYTGSIYGLQAPSKRVTKKANEWQKMVIICKGPVVRVILNGEQIIDANLIHYMDQERTHPGIKRRKGYIGLQNHSSRIEYRNIRLTELR